MLEVVPDIAQTTHSIRNIFADIRNVPTAFFCACCSTSGSDGIIIADGNELFQRHFYFSASRLCLVAVYISIQSSLGPEQMIAAVRKEIKYVTAPTG